MLFAKIHGAIVTCADVDYEGSLTVPPELLSAAGLRPCEAIQVWNVTRGTRLETYTIEGLPGSSDVCANGAAAHQIHPGDKIIMAAFAWIPEHQIAEHQPRLVFLDESNQITHTGPEIAGPRDRTAAEGC